VVEPPWSASTTQVPAPVKVTTAPDNEHPVLEVSSEKLTGSPDVALAVAV